MSVEKVKVHIRTNKKVYVALITGVVIGGVSMFVWTHHTNSKIIMMRLWSPGDNNIMKVFINPLGDPGNVVQCLETGTVYASQGQAARELGVLPCRISDHLSGKLSDVKGNHLVIIGKAGQALAE